MAQTYTTTDGDMLDDICFRYYGYSSTTVEAVLTANRELANLMPVFGPGVQIYLPDIAAPATTKPVLRIWDNG